MDDIIKDFLIESTENLDRLDQELVQLESDPASKDLLASIFRTIHTIKGSCGFLGFARLEKVAHAGESLLSRLREHELTLTAEVTSGLLAMVDAVRHMLSEIQSTGNDGENDYPELLETLKKLQGLNGATSPTKPAAEQPPAATEQVAAPVAEVAEITVQKEEPPAAFENPPAPESAPQKKTKKTTKAARGPQSGDGQHRPVSGKLGGLLVERGHIRPEDLALALAEQEQGDQRRVGEILVSLGLCKLEDVLAAQQILETRGREDGVETVRVGVKLLDQLMNLVGELVLARNQLLQYSNSTSDSGFHAISQRVDLIASELQEGVMKTRMQPIRNVWNKFPRTVRDLALSCGKEVALDMEGQETELDRTVLEAVKDPLTHLLRNSIDHGIELPEARQRAGKPAAGHVSLRAFHEGGQVNIEISDDGAGLNTEKIRATAVQRGVIPAEQAARMAERDIFNLIFLPGFSTAEKVTNVSGRGVGMDVVRTNLEKIGGSVDLHSTAGKGTAVRIKIPLTLAIVPALVVRCGGERFAIPQMSLTELVRLESKAAIEVVHGAPVYRLRGQLLPLVYLRAVLGAKAEGTTPESRTAAVDLVDFAAAREKHLQWISRLQDMLDGKATLTIDQACSYRDCPLGKWLYGGGMREWGDMAEMRALEQAHRHFHGLVRDVVVAKVDGFDANAHKAFAGVAPLTRQIVDLLKAVENKRALAMENVNLVVLQAGSRQFGLIVDDILDTEEIVVKPLPRQLKGIGIYAGATIMGDGSVALILDVLGLAQRSNLLTESHDKAGEVAGGVSGEEARQNEQAGALARDAVLLAENGPEGRVAIPLHSVARLEEFPGSVIEYAGTQPVMQYRGEIIPLVRLSEVVPAAEAAAESEGSPIHVVVYREKELTVGLIVDRMLDIVSVGAEVQAVNPRPGVTGTCVVGQRVTDVLDVGVIVRAAIARFREVHSGAEF